MPALATLENALAGLAHVAHSEEAERRRRFAQHEEQRIREQGAVLWQWAHGRSGQAWRNQLTMQGVPQMLVAQSATGPEQLWLLAAGDCALGASSKPGEPPIPLASWIKLMDLQVDWRVTCGKREAPCAEFLTSTKPNANFIDSLLTGDLQAGPRRTALAKEWVAEVLGPDALAGRPELPRTLAQLPADLLLPDVPASDQLARSLREVVWSWAHGPSVARVRQGLQRDAVGGVMVFTAGHCDVIALTGSGDLPLQYRSTNRVRSRTPSAPLAGPERLPVGDTRRRDWLTCYLELARHIDAGTEDRWLAQQLVKHNEVALAKAQARKWAVAERKE